MIEMTMTAAKETALNGMCPGASANALGTEVKAIADRVAENQVDSVATDATGIVADFNALLAKLKAAGLMAPDA